MPSGGRRPGAGRPPGVIETRPRKRIARPPRPDVFKALRGQIDEWSEDNLVPEIIALYKGSKDNRLKLEILKLFAAYSLGMPHASASVDVTQKWGATFETLAADLAQNRNDVTIEGTGEVAALPLPAENGDDAPPLISAGSRNQSSDEAAPEPEPREIEVQSALHAWNAAHEAGSR